MSQEASRASHPASALLVLIGASLLALAWIYLGYSHNDEVELLSIGMRVVHGQVPYRDFFWCDPPLADWLAALPGWLFGPNVVAARWMQLSLLVVATFEAYWLACRLGALPWLAAVASFLLLGCFYAGVPGVDHHWLVLPFVMTALTLGVRAVEAEASLASSGGRTAVCWAGAGVSAALALLVIHGDGAVVTVALALTASLGGWLAGQPAGRWLRALAALLAGWALPVAIVVAMLVAGGTLHDAYLALVWPLRHYRTTGSINDLRYLTDLYQAVRPMQDTPFARPMWYLTLYTFLLTTLVPVVVAAVACLWGLGLVSQRLAASPVTVLTRARGLVALMAVGGAMYGLYGRADMEHLGYIAMPAVILVAVAISWGWRTAVAPWRLAAAAPVLALALWLGGGLAHAFGYWTMFPQSFWTFKGPELRARADGVLGFLHDHARPGDRIVAVPAGGYYYYYGLPPAVSLTTVYDRAAHFLPDDTMSAFWRNVSTCGARYLVVDPSSEPFMHDAFPGPPPGYVKVFTAPTLRYIGPWVTVYERQAAGDRAVATAGQGR